MVDDAVLQQSLAQVDAFLRVARLADLHQPGHKLAAQKSHYFTMLNGFHLSKKEKSQSAKTLIRPYLQEHKGWAVEIHDSFMKSSACCRRKVKRKTSSVPKQHAAATK